MRLISARVRGYGRLVDAKINLDSKVIAVVGPNEAGKTTLLKALAHLDSNAPVSVAERSRATNVADNAPIVSADYVLDDDDRAQLADLEVEEAPRSMITTRPAGGGNIQIGFVPRVRKAVAPLGALLAAVVGALAQDDLSPLIEPQGHYGPDADPHRDFRSELSALAAGVELLFADDGDAPSEDEFGDRVAELLHGTVATEDNAPFRDALGQIVNWCKRVDPAIDARTRMWSNTPDFLIFDEPERTLQSAYTLDDDLVERTPRAFANLASMAGLDLHALLQHLQTGDVARRESLVQKANTELERIFAASWKQSTLTVRLIVDGSNIRVMLWEDGDNITEFSERSAGLRMFIALMAFLKVQGHTRMPILLIDEADNHLHIDAQADLVNMFMAQDQALKVIYTTHSPACLPPDLGSGVRAVVPRKDNLQISEIENSFWRNAAGFSPLLMAMGAAAAAFTPARRVVLAEGASEMLLLPPLMRAALGVDQLPYQVAPGLSETPKDLYPDLDFEGAKVAYLVDGDGGGRDLKKALKRQGVPENLIITIGVPGIENLVDSQAFSDAVRGLLLEKVSPEALPDLPKFEKPDGTSWSRVLEAWLESQPALPRPSKIAIVSWLVENDRAVPNEPGRGLLKAAHKELLKATGNSSKK